MNLFNLRFALCAFQFVEGKLIKITLGKRLEKPEREKQNNNSGRTCRSLTQFLTERSGQTLAITIYYIWCSLPSPPTALGVRVRVRATRIINSVKKTDKEE